MEKKKQELSEEEQIAEDIRRIKLPKGRECIGIVERRVGGSRMLVRCLDGKTRNCRIPGRLKRRLWVREGDIVVVEAWEFSGDDKGDIIFKYKPTQVKWLKNKGHLRALEEAEEF